MCSTINREIGQTTNEINKGTFFFQGVLHLNVKRRTMINQNRPFQAHLPNGIFNPDR